MTAEALLMEEVKGLPQESIALLAEIARLFKSGSTQAALADIDGSMQGAATKPKKKLGGMEGKILYIADDFDETPDCFEEYM